MADITEVPGLAEDEFLMLPEKILMKIIRYSSNPDRKNIGLKHTALRFFFLVETDIHPLSLHCRQVSDTNARIECVSFNFIQFKLLS